MAGYGDDAGFTDWLAENGHTLPVGTPSSAVLRQRGSVYLDGLYGSPLADRRFSGVPTNGVTQDRAWPRTGAKAFGAVIDDDLVPIGIINASYAAAYYEATSPGGLSVIATDAGTVKREKVGPIETEYFGGSDGALAASTPMLLTVDGLVAPFLVPGSTSGPYVWAIGAPRL
jgi:hypothetical protein